MSARLERRFSVMRQDGYLAELSGLYKLYI